MSITEPRAASTPALFHKLANGDWIEAHDNLILCGPTDPAS